MGRPDVPSPSHHLRNNKDPVSIFEIVFGSCGGFLEACFMTRMGNNAKTSEGCMRTTTITNPVQSTTRAVIGPQHTIIPSKQVQETRHSLKRSKEVVEIPEFLGSEFLDWNAHKGNCDEISAISAMTLEELALRPPSLYSPPRTSNRGKGKVHMHASSLPPSPASTVASDSTDGGDRYDAVDKTDRYFMEPPLVVKKVTSFQTNDSAYLTATYSMDSSLCKSRETRHMPASTYGPMTPKKRMLRGMVLSR